MGAICKTKLFIFCMMSMEGTFLSVPVICGN